MNISKLYVLMIMTIFLKKRGIILKEIRYTKKIVPAVSNFKPVLCLDSEV